MKKLLQEDFQSLSVDLKQMLQRTRRITICIDGWSTKSLSASYVGISACFYDPVLDKPGPKHAFLNFSNIEHPHTGEKLAECINRSLKQWNIPEDKIILVVSDNGSNMLKAIRLLREEAENLETDEENETEEFTDVSDSEADEDNVTEDDSETGRSNEDDSQLKLPHVPFRRMPCMAHTLQLIIKLAYAHYDTLIVKTRRMVGRIRKSSVATEKLLARSGQSLITDVSTRWNSTYYMIQRLLNMKAAVTDVLSEMGMNFLFFLANVVFFR